MSYRATVKGFVDELVKSIEAKYDADRTSLDTWLQVKDRIEFAAGMGEWKSPRPIRILVTPPKGPLNSEFSSALTANLSVSVFVVVKVMTEADALLLLREATGLVVDAIVSDRTVNGSIEAPGLVNVEILDWAADGGTFEQEIRVTGVKLLT